MSGLTIYRASAGSGKTFTITREYINLLFSDADNYRRILGVTFTNKATAEMKGRILSELDKLAKDKYTDYTDELMVRFKLTKTELRERASFILTSIIHDYSHFSILTIDSFFQRILKAFAREAGFYRGFEIELDQKKILNMSIDQMIYDLDSNLTLKNWLVKFAELRIVEGSGWNIKHDIEFIGNEVFKEKFNELGSQLIEKMTNKEFLDNFNKKLSYITGKFEFELNSRGKQALEIINEYNLITEDFKGRSRSIGKFFENISQKEKFNGLEISKTIYNHHNNIDQWLGSDKLKHKDIESAYNSGLNNILGAITNLYINNYPVYQTALEVQKNIYILGVVSDLLQSIRTYSNEKNIFVLSDASRFLNLLIGNSDAPFLYEKTGTFIRHFMIDEFQDTSKLQWENFKPLVLNSLGEGNSNWIVGDVKQSIYRWRNSDWTILSGKIFEDVHPFPVKEIPLYYNWRSSYPVVSFNNTFFRNAVDILLNQFRSDNEDNVLNGTDDFEQLLSEAYNNFKQMVPENKSKPEGMVRIDFINDEKDNDLKFDEISMSRVALMIKQLQEKGYLLSDMAILVRTRSEANKISEYLSRCQKEQKNVRYDVISNDSLLLRNSEIVKWIISVFKFILAPIDHLNRIFLFYEYIEYINAADYGNKFSNDCFINKGNIFGLLELDDFFKNKQLRKYAVYELANKVIDHFRLTELEGELTFILAFQDMLQEYSRKEPPDICSFLLWWDENKDKQVINMPQSQDAIRLMTFHTAKGLEFRIVFIPFADWTIMKSGYNSDILWCSTKVQPFNDLEIIPVSISKGLQNTVFYKDYFKEKALSLIDNLNLLYVAFTRAIEGMYILVPESSKDSVSNNAGKLINLSLKAVNNIEGQKGYPLISFSDFWDETTKTFIYGNLIHKSSVNTQVTHNINIDKTDYISGDISRVAHQVIQAEEYFVDDNIRLISKINAGKVMHEIFQRINYTTDIDFALHDMLYEGKISEGDIKPLTVLIRRAFNNDNIKQWFSEDWDILKEAGILLENGSTLRPDRVLIKNNKAVVIDYKFGTVENDSHKKQVLNYMKYLRLMNYEKVEGFIWYVNLDKVVEVNQ